VAAILNIDVRKGMVIVHEGQLWLCVDRDLRTPGNLPSKLTLKLKNIKTGLVNEFRVHPENKTEQAYLDRRDMEYLYKDADGYVFMDKETYEQITLTEDNVGDLPLFLKENQRLSGDLLREQAVEHRPSRSGRTEGDRDRPRHQGSHGRGSVQARHPGDRPEGHRTAAHRHRRRPRHRHRRGRQVRQPRQVSDRGYYHVREAEGSMKDDGGGPATPGSISHPSSCLPHPSSRASDGVFQHATLPPASAAVAGRPARPRPRR